MKKKGYGFVYVKDMPSLKYEDVDIEGLDADALAVTGTYSDIADNHCATVCLTNLIKLGMRLRDETLLSVFDEKTEEKDIFGGIYAITGDGPIFALKHNLVKYMKPLNVGVEKIKYHSLDEVKEALKAQIPVALLVKGYNLNEWHWIICVGMRTYEDGSVYLRIIDNWNRTLIRFMPVKKKKPWISAISFKFKTK